MDTPPDGDSPQGIAGGVAGKAGYAVVLYVVCAGLICGGLLIGYLFGVTVGWLLGLLFTHIYLLLALLAVGILQLPILWLFNFYWPHVKRRHHL